MIILKHLKYRLNNKPIYDYSLGTKPHNKPSEGCDVALRSPTCGRDKVPDTYSQELRGDVKPLDATNKQIECYTSFSLSPLRIPLGIGATDSGVVERLRQEEEKLLLSRFSKNPLINDEDFDQLMRRRYG